MKKIDLRNTLQVYNEIELFVDEMFHKKNIYFQDYSFSIDEEKIIITTYSVSENKFLLDKELYEYSWNHFLSWLNNKQKAELTQW